MYTYMYVYVYIQMHFFPQYCSPREAQPRHSCRMTALLLEGSHLLTTQLDAETQVLWTETKHPARVQSQFLSPTHNLASFQSRFSCLDACSIPESTVKVLLKQH